MYERAEIDMAILVSSILRGRVVWVKERVTLTGCNTRFSKCHIIHVGNRKKEGQR